MPRNQTKKHKLGALGTGSSDGPRPLPLLGSGWMAFWIFSVGLSGGESVSRMGDLVCGRRKASGFSGGRTILSRLQIGLTSLGHRRLDPG